MINLFRNDLNNTNLTHFSMKKLYFSFAMLAMVFSVSAQDTLQPINWITFPTNLDWATNPVPKAIVTIPKAAANWTFDENNFDLSTFWATQELGAENQIKNQTLAAGGISFSAKNFGA